MSWKNSIFYILLVIAIAGMSALTGAIAGGAVVYRALQQLAHLPAPIEKCPRREHKSRSDPYAQYNGCRDVHYAVCRKSGISGGNRGRDRP
jgi:hypothetical protein